MMGVLPVNLFAVFGVSCQTGDVNRLVRVRVIEEVSPALLVMGLENRSIAFGA